MYTLHLTLGRKINPHICARVMQACPKLLSLDVAESYFGDGGLGGYSWCNTEQASDLQSLTLWSPHKFPSDDAVPLRCRLSRLELHLNALQKISEAQYHTLLHNSRDTLSSLTLGTGNLASAINLSTYLSQSTFSRLRSLTIWHLGSDQTPWVIAANSISSLTSLSLENASQRSLAGLRRLVAPKLESLTLRRTDEPERFGVPALHELLGVIRDGTLNELRRLNLPTVTKAMVASAPGVVLFEECERKSIVLSCASGIM
ncbi:hypothetical protein RQP46_011217 [Phenoliferia psychrophenolica]